MEDSGFEKRNDTWKLREWVVEDRIATIQEGKERVKKKRIMGLHAGGGIWMSDDFDAPLPDEFWLGKS